MSIFNPDRPHPVLNLVSCVSTKLERKAPTPAKDLYCSQWFKLVRKVMEQRGEPWGILSAEYGLLDHDAMIFAYDKTLNTMAREERQHWAREKVLRFMPPAKLYRIWAGERYAEFLAGPLMAELPLKGLGIGRQLGHLSKLVHALPAPQSMRPCAQLAAKSAGLA